MRKITTLFSAMFFMVVSWQAYAQSVSATYTAGNIPVGDGAYDPACNGPATPLVVSLPAGTWLVDSVSVSYNMTADAGIGAWMSEQQSQIGCQETGLNEGTYASGAGNNSGTFSYARTNLNVANGIHTGNLTFEMQAFRTWSGVAGCNLTQSIDSATWTVTVHYSNPPSCFFPGSLTATGITATSANLGWNETGTATNWEVEYGTAGFTQGAGTSAITTTNPHAVSSLTPNTSYDFYVRAICGAGDSSIWIGPFNFATPVSCPAPTNLTSTSPNSTSAILGWTENGSATSWQIEWDSAGFTQGAGNFVITGTNPHTLSSLGASTSYDFYVRAVCGAGDSSLWVGPFNFTTPCATIALPWSEGFENGGTIPACWSMAGGENWLFNTSGPNHVGNGGTITGTTVTGNYYAVVDASGSDAPATLTSPLVDLSSLTTPQLSFYEISDNEGFANSQLDVEVWDGAAWNTVATYDTNTAGWEKRELNLSALTFTGPAAVRFTFSEIVSGDFYDDIAIDDVTFEELPLCAAPSALNVTSLTSTSALLGWTENGTATSWNIEWDTAGFTQGTGTSAIDTANPHAVSGLTPNTSYEFYVRAICGAGDTSTWTGPFTFTTLCSSFALPWSEGFENGGTIPDCWTMGGGEDWLFNTSGPNHVGNLGNITGSTVTGNYYAVVDASGSHAPATLTSPFVDISSLTTPQLVFYEISDNEGNANSQLDVEVWDGAAWNAVATYNTNTNGWMKREIDLSTLTITGNVAVRFTFSEIVSGDFYDDIAIDDVTFRETPLNDLGVIAITGPSNGCDLSTTETVEVEVYNFAAGAQSSYDMVYAINGTPITPEAVTTTINPGDTLVYTFTTPADLSAGGAYVITAYVNLTGDVDNSNDSSAARSVVNTPSPADPVTTGDYACNVPGAYTVSATGDNIYWFDASVGGNQVGQGNSFTTPTISATTSYFAESNAQIGGQMFTTHFNGGNGCNNGNMFNLVATSDFTIDSFVVTPNVASASMFVDIYYIESPFEAFSTIDTLWTFLGSETLTNTTAGTSEVASVGGLTMSAGDTFGIYINANLQYTTGTNVFSNGDMTITNSNGLCTAWSGSPNVGREWNGSIYYTKNTGCISGRVEAVVDYGCLSIGSELNNSIHVYPNPTNDIINIEFESLESNNSVQLLSLTGETLRSININNTLTTIDVSDFSKGLYTLKIISGDAIGYKKLIIE